MNIISLIILAALFGNFVLGLLADILNLSRLRPDLPAAFSDIYDPEQYQRSQEYLRVNTRFGWITAVFQLAVLLLFWFGNGFPWLDQAVRSLRYGSVLTGLIYMGTLVLFRALLALPFSIYDTFVIEERFGFNKTTWKVYVADLVKGLLLGLVLGGPLLAGVLAFFEYAGANAWWCCWIAVTLFMLFVQFMAPTWIMPLFNKFTPIENGPLKTAILDYAASIRFPIQNVYVMDGSKRSSKSNAFFTGFGRNKRIVLFDTLIAQHSVPELVAVLAHEMGHFKKKHILWMLAFGIVQMGIVFYLLSIFISHPGLFEAFYMDRPSVYAGLIFFGLLYSPMDFFISLLVQMFSRRNEYAADRFAVETTGDSESLASALKKLSVKNLSNLLPHPFYVFLNYTHPPVLERINAFMKIGRKANGQARS